MRASAPGKVMWAGEYAVLDGAPAVLTCVARRAVASFQAAPGRSPLLSALREVIAEQHPEVVQAATDLWVDSSALADEGQGQVKKLGIGSSAATVVAAARLALAQADLDTVHAVAREAHARAQGKKGARGSGADVAAVVHGGVVAVRPGADLPAVTPLPWPPGLEAVLVSTGIVASTPELVAKVRAQDPDLAPLGQAAEALVAAFARGPAEVIAAVTAAGQAIAELGRQTGLPLVPQALEPTLDLARRQGGVAKTTGAGGGDQLLVVLPSSAAARAFLEEARGAGLSAWALPLDHDGARLEPASEST